MKLELWRTMRERPGLALAAVFLVIALLMGGSGSRPVWTMMIELAALVVLAFFAVSRRYAPTANASVPLAILALILLVPLVQLMPLPWETWTALPGRGLATQILTLAGMQGRAMPMSLEPESTLLSALALLPAAAMLVATLCLGTRDRRTLIKVLVAGALLSAVLGAFQYATKGQLTLFRTGHRGFPIGLFSNRNHQADMMLMGTVLIAGLGAAAFWHPARTPEESSRRWLAAGLIAVFAIATIATTSRMGVSLLPAALFMAALLLVKLRGKKILLGLAGAFAVAAVSLPLLMQNAVVARTLDRFSTDEDSRYLFWLDTIFGIPQYAPFGSGVGSFSTIFKTVEALDHVGPGIVNHAHNEYLELALETGFAAGALFLLFLGFLTWCALRLARADSNAPETLVARAALCGIVLILLHSIVDYPLRMLSFAAAFGLLCGVLLLRGRAESRPRAA